MMQEIHIKAALDQPPTPVHPTQEAADGLEAAFKAHDQALGDMAAADGKVLDAQYDLAAAEAACVPHTPETLKNDLIRQAWLTRVSADERQALHIAKREQIVARQNLGIAENAVSLWKHRVRLLEVQVGLLQARQR